MLIGVLILCFEVPVSALEMREVQDSALAGFDDTVIIVIVWGWVDGLVSLWGLLWLFWEVNILRKCTFRVSYRSHDVGIAKITSFSYSLIAACHPRHVDHTWIPAWRCCYSLLLLGLDHLTWLWLQLFNWLFLRTLSSWDELWSRRRNRCRNLLRFSRRFFLRHLSVVHLQDIPDQLRLVLS